MPDGQQSSTYGKLALTFRQAVAAATKGSLIPFLFAVITLSAILILFLVNLSSQIITIVNSDYAIFVITAITVLVIIVFCATFFGVLWDRATTSVSRENEALRIELSAVKEHLATSLARNRDLVEKQAANSEALRGKLLYEIQGFFDRLLSQIRMAQVLAINPELSASNLRTTFVQLHGNSLTVILPIGKKHGAVESLIYYVDRPSKVPTGWTSPLGMITLNEIEEDRSLATVFYQANTEEAERFWGAVRARCQQESGYKEELDIKPAVDAVFRGKSSEILIVSENLLEALKNGLREIISTNAVEDMSSSNVNNGDEYND